MSSRKRRHEDSENEEYEDGKITSGDEEEEGEIDVKSRKKKSKKSKKHKKDKRGHHHKSKKRSRKRSEDEDGAESGSATDKEGGSTPEIEAGEVLEISDDENVNNDHRNNADDGRSRSSSAVRGKRSSRRSSRSRSRSRSRDQQQDSPQSFKREKSYTPPPMSKKNRDSNNKSLKSRKSPSPAGPESSSKGSTESLSIEETNKLRASLGLAPLKVETKDKKSEDRNEKDDDQKEGKLIPNSTVRHKPAENLTEKSATEKMRERLQQRKMKRQQESKLLTVSTLGAEDNDVDDTSKWLARQKKKEKEKKAAEKRAKMLEELDDDFGVGNIVKEDASKTKASSYGSGNLAGLTVQHDANKFQEGKSIILTLKDADVLDEDMEDTLINVNMIDDEKVDKNKENLKKSKAGYNPYDQEEIDEETGELRKKNMLDKYDEEIDGETKKSFVIGNQGKFSEAEEVQRRREEIRKKLAKRNVESLEMPQQKVASDYYTEEEVVKFKKPKKKKKVKRKMLKADDLLALNDVNTEQSRIKQEYSRDEGTRGSIPMDMDEEDVKPKINDEDLSKIKVDDDDLDLQFALNKARRLKQRKQFDHDRTAKFLEENGLHTIKKETVDDDDDDDIKDEFQSLDQSTGAEFISTFADDKQNSNIILNETSEFCRHLGAWRSHEASGLGESVSKDILDFEQSLTGISKFEKQRKNQAAAATTSSEDEDDPMEGEGARRFKRDAFSSLIDQEDKQAVILDEEPDLQSGVAAAIKLASNKGYWETEETSTKSSNMKHLECQNYTIEDKGGAGGDDRGSRRGGGGADRYGGGGTGQNWVEKKDYKPNVKLEYIDDSGRKLNQKEAFRHLSHKFHGKGSGKLKSEKRMKQIDEKNMIIGMSSTDTPLNTLAKLRDRQKQAATPYVILSGNKVQATNLKK